MTARLEFRPSMTPSKSFKERLLSSHRETDDSRKLHAPLRI